MAPAGQHFEADQMTAAELHDGLVVRHDLAPLQPTSQLAVGAQRQHGRIVRSGGEHLDTVAAASLGSIHRRVSVAEKIGGRNAGAVGYGDSYACGDEQLGAVDDQRLGDLGAQPLSDLDRRDSGADVAEHDDELVATESAEHVAIADDGAQALAHAAQQLVAYAVAQAVVDDLEVVDVDEHHCDCARLTVLEEMGELLEEAEAVG